jgi:PAS domain S-box-containing protein
VEGPTDAQAVRESLTLLETLLASAPIGFGFLDLQWRFVRVNPAMAVMTGLTPAQHVGRSVAEVVPALWSQVEPALRRLVDTGEPLVNHELVGESPASPGRIGHWLDSFYPVRIGARVVGVGFTVVDVTESVRARELQSVIMRTMLEGLYAADRDGRTTYVNAAAERMLGWTEAELRGSHRLGGGARAELPVAELEHIVGRVLRDERPVRLADATLTRRDGVVLPVTYSATPLLTRAGVHGVVVVFRDATEERDERVRAARELDALTLVGRTRDALDEGRLVLYSQPIRPLRGGSPREELLLRMIDRRGDVIAPGAFLPAAEKYGLIGEIDQWVIRQTMRLASRGRVVEANLSAQSTTNIRVLDLIDRELQASAVDPAKVGFELTETALMSDIGAGEAFADGLAGLGCRLGLDDFGTGYGSFTYLKRLPIRSLKIDVDFVRDLPDNAANQHLVSAIVGLAQGFELETVAEGVEDEATLALLREYGVDYAQGYHIGRPAPIADFGMPSINDGPHTGERGPVV